MQEDFSSRAYHLFGVCQGCEESFTYVDNEDNTYTFTYTPAEDMTNVLVVFTFAQATAVSGFDGTWTFAGQTVQKYMDFTTCQEYIWNITLEKDCNAGAPNNNVWTDFKVDGVSKKANPEDKFTQPCP